MCFLPQDEEARDFAVKQFEHFIEGREARRCSAGATCRPTPTGLGKAVIERMPVIRQAIVGRGPNVADQDAFERKLLAIRKQTQNPLAELAKKHKLPGLPQLYMPSFSTRTVVYKGLLLAPQVEQLLRGPAQSADASRRSALVHQRFSTNTFPSLEAGAPLPLHRPQRRDQHGARQRQLDERAPAHAWNPTCSAPTSTRCGRSSRTASRTPPASTTRSSCWSPAATRWRTR